MHQIKIVAGRIKVISFILIIIKKEIKKDMLN